MNWVDSVAVEQLDDGRFHAYVGEEWSSLQGVHGGIVAALVLTATEQVLHQADVDPATTLRAATFGYASGNNVGDLTIDVEVIRRGRTMVTTHARTTQGDKVTTIARFHHSSPRGGPEYSAAPRPPVRPADAVRLRWGEQPAHLKNVETYLHPETGLFAGTDRAEWIAWSRPLHGNTFDSSWLTMFGDYFPPAVFTRVTERQRAVTVEYAIQIHSDAASWTIRDDEYLAARMHAFHSRDGFAVEDGWIYLPDGTLLATVRQTRLAG